MTVDPTQAPQRLSLTDPIPAWSRIRLVATDVDGTVGVANVLDYRDQLPHLPRYVTAEPEGNGFQQLAQILLASKR